MSEEIGDYEESEISKRVERLLKDLGNPEPPLKLNDVRELLRLHLRYYNTTDPTFIQDLVHRASVTWNKDVKGLLKHLKAAVDKSKFSAFWSPANREILIDHDVPDPKVRWIEAHEISHSLIPWHADYLLGDTLQMLDPTCHEMIEGEANYGAGQLLFLQKRFSLEARDNPVSFNAIKDLAKTYGNTIQSTLWRFVEERHPTLPMFGMVSIHPRYPQIGAHDGPDPWRYFIRSKGFRTQFGNVTPKQAFDLLRKHSGFAKRGPIVDATDFLLDANSIRREFRLEAFSNSYALLAYGIVSKE